MKKWLAKRLAGSKQESPVWLELSEALEEFWDTYYLPAVEALEDSRSVFTASNEDLAHRMLDLGDFFDVNLPIAQYNKPLSIIFRRDEIRWKNTDLPISSILYRNFQGLNTRWEPLFVPLGASYIPNNLFSEEEIIRNDGDLDDYFMSSRGRIWVDEGHLRRMGYNRQEFTKLAEVEVKKVKPVHIVYDGTKFVLTIRIDAEPFKFSHASLLKKLHRGPYQYQNRTVGRSSTLKRSQEYGNFLRGLPWSLDQFIPYDTDSDDKIISRPLPGIEGDWLPPLMSYRVKSKQPVLLDPRKLIAPPTLKAPKEQKIFLFPSASENQKQTRRKDRRLKFQAPNTKLFVNLDDVPCDWIPLDSAIPIDN